MSYNSRKRMYEDKQEAGALGYIALLLETSHATVILTFNEQEKREDGVLEDSKARNRGKGFVAHGVEVILS